MAEVTVRGPDGKLYRFRNREAARRGMADLFPEQAEQFRRQSAARSIDLAADPPERSPLRPAGITTGGLVEGAVSGVGTLASLPMDAGYNLVQAARRNIFGSDDAEYGAPFTQGVQRLGGQVREAVGLPEAETDRERLYAAASRGVGEALAGAGAGAGAARAGRAVGSQILEGSGRTLAAAPVTQGVAGGAAGGAVEQARQSGSGELGQLGAGLAAGLGVGVGAGVVGGARNLAAPFHRSGREDIVGNLLRDQARDPDAAARALENVPEIVPGSRPFTGSASRDPGLLSLERGVRRMNEASGAVGERRSANNLARQQLLRRVTPTEAQSARRREGFRDYADRETARLFDRPLDDVDVEPVYREIGRTRRSRQGENETVEAAMDLAEKQLQPVTKTEQPFMRPGRADDLDRIRALSDFVRNGRPPGQRPQRLASFLRQYGFQPGTRDKGEIEIITDKGGRGRGMFTRRGQFRDLDDAAELAHQEGFIEERDTRALLDALDEDLKRSPVYRRADEESVRAWREWDDAQEQLDEYMREYAPEPGTTPRQLADQIEADPSSYDGEPTRVANPGRLEQRRRNIASRFDGSGGGSRRGFDEVPGRYGANVNLRTAYRFTKPVIDRIDEAIESRVPGYREYLKEYGRQVKRYDRGETMRAMLERFQSSGSPDIATGEPTLMLGTMRRATRDLIGHPDFKKLSPTQQRTIRKVADDLAREMAPEAATVREPGSDTFKNLSTASFIARTFGTDAALPRQLGSTVQLLYATPERQVTDLLIEAMMEPDLAMKLLRRASPQSVADVSNELVRLGAGSQATFRVAPSESLRE